MMEQFELDIGKLVKRKGETGDFIFYDPTNCDGCGMCVDVCSFSLWSVKGGKARLAPRYRELCIECAGCWEICGREAIDFSYPQGGSGVIYEYG